MFNNIMKSLSNDYVTGTLATSAIMYPTFNLQQISSDAQLILPILGVVLILVQIYIYIRYHSNKGED